MRDFVFQLGYVQAIDALELGKVILELGAGRAVAGAVIDHSVGFRLLVKVGSKLDKGGYIIIKERCVHVRRWIVVSHFYFL